MGFVVVIGDGGHGQDIAAMLDECVVLHTDADLPADPTYPVVVGINDPATRAQVTASVLGRGWRLADPVIHKSAVIGPGCTLAPGTVVGALTSLTRDVHLGTGVHVGAGVHLTRTTIGDGTTISPGAVICGDVTTGLTCLIGAGSVLKNLITVGDRVTVGCGAAVVNDVPSDTTVVGVPAK